MFINLAVHSHYSLLMSSISIDDIINHARVNKQKHAALIDINNMYGAMEFYQKATINDLIPIIGLQITYQNTKVILIAKNADGYHNLVKLSSCIMTNTPYDVNTYVPNTYVIVENIQSAKWLKTHKEVYSLNLKADNPIALQECFFENKADVKYLKALMAIGSDQRLSAFDNYHEYDDKYMLSEEQAKHKFSQQALKNLEHVINTCT
jgi:DNA polymerase-3 subunit alpha